MVEDKLSRDIGKNPEKLPCPWGEFALSRGKFLCPGSQFDACPGVNHGKNNISTSHERFYSERAH